MDTDGVAGTERGQIVAIALGQQFFDNEVRHDIYPFEF
jgi:hypothetical protein